MDFKLGWSHWSVLFTLLFSLLPGESLGELCPQARCDEAIVPGTMIPTCCILQSDTRLPQHVRASSSNDRSLLLGTNEGDIWEVLVPSSNPMDAVNQPSLFSLRTDPRFDFMAPELLILHMDGSGGALASTEEQVFVRKAPEESWRMTGVSPDVAQGAMWAGDSYYLLGGGSGLFCLDSTGEESRRIPFKGILGPGIRSLAVHRNYLYVGLGSGGLLELEFDRNKDCGGLSFDEAAWVQSPLPKNDRFSVTALLPSFGVGLVGLGDGRVLKGLKELNPLIRSSNRPKNGGRIPFEPVLRLLSAPVGFWLVYSDRIIQLGPDGERLAFYGESGGLDVTSTFGTLAWKHPEIGWVLTVGQSTLIPMLPPSSNDGGCDGRFTIGEKIFLSLLIPTGIYLFFLGRSKKREEE